MTAMRLPPLVPGDWRDVPVADVEPLVGRFWMAWSEQRGGHGLGALEGMGVVRLEAARVLRLACYPRHLLVEVTGADDDGPVAAAALYGPDGLSVLTGESRVLHELNDLGWLELGDVRAVADYFRLFVSVVHAATGRFELIEDEAALRAAGLAGDVPEEALPGPALVVAEGEAFQVSGLIRYGAWLFRADFQVTRDGLVTMLGDEPLDMSLPLGAERFRVPFRGAPQPVDGEDAA
jgi:hypothetical protein